MDVKMKCERPADIVYTLTISMPASDWERLREQLSASQFSTSYPSWQLRDNISDLLNQARKTFWPTAPKPAVDHQGGQ